jgi:hypothetical protein
LRIPSIISISLKKNIIIFQLRKQIIYLNNEKKNNYSYIKQQKKERKEANDIFYTLIILKIEEKRGNKKCQI